MSTISYDLDKIRTHLESIDNKLQKAKLSYVDFGLEGSSSGLNSFVYSYVRLANFLDKYRVFVQKDILDVCNTINDYVKSDNATAKHFMGNQAYFMEFTVNIDNSVKPFRRQSVSDPQDVSYSLGGSHSPLPSINTSSFVVSRLDTENMASKLSSSLISLSLELVELNRLIDAFSKDASALTGQYAEAMKMYWAEVHIPIVKAIDTALWTLNTHMTNYSSELYQLVSDDSYFVLTQSEMEASVNELTNIRASLAIIVDDVDSGIASYSSLLGVNVTIPNGRPMLDKYQQAASKIQTLVENVGNYESSKVTLVKGYIDEFVTNMSKVIDTVDDRIKDKTRYSKNLFNTIYKAQDLKLVTEAKACERDEDTLIAAFEAEHPEYADAMNKFLNNDHDPLANLPDDMKKRIKYTAYTAPEPYRTIIMNEIMNKKITIGVLNTQLLHWKDIEMRSHNIPYTGIIDFSKYDRESISTFWHEFGHASDNQGAPFYSPWGSIQTPDAFKVYCPGLGKEVTFAEAMKYDIYDNPNNPHSIYSVAKSCGVPGNYENVAKAFWEKSNNPKTFFDNSYKMLSDEDKKLYEEVCKRFQNEMSNYPEYSAVADTYGGMTRNGIVTTYDSQNHTGTGYAFNGYGIHPEKWYWFMPELIAPTEFYAEYFSAQATGNAAKVALMRKYYPEACKVADEYSKYLANQ